MRLKSSLQIISDARVEATTLTLQKVQAPKIQYQPHLIRTQKPQHTVVNIGNFINIKPKSLKNRYKVFKTVSIL